MKAFAGDSSNVVQIFPQRVENIVVLQETSPSTMAASGFKYNA